MRLASQLPAIVLCLLSSSVQARFVPLEDEFGIDSRADVLHAGYLEHRRDAIPDIISPFQVPPKARIVQEDPEPWADTRHRWRRGITATVFWIGEKSSERNPTANHASSWDPNWQLNYGGVDAPENRLGFRPAAFTPRLNPFYIALPYNDIAPGGGHHPEAAKVIPWYWKSYKGSWSSVCKGRWIAIHYRGKVCYAQWEDCGPFNTDDWQYVFKGQQPKPNPNGNAGIDISPAARDFLGIRSGYRVSWKFAEEGEVPDGPWTQWQLNN
ncbi:MAG: hypothetical protein H7A51_19135 [Akkermansiaceae bacterium]|nr:hypothetical protein [Akkermansiaceae bacterium]